MALAALLMYYAILAALCFGFYNLLLKMGSSKLDAALGAFVLQAVAALTGLGVLGVKVLTREQLAPSQPGGYWLAIGAGLCVGLAEWLGFLAYRKGLPASVGTPLMTGGGVAVAVLLGILVLKETVTMRQAIGLALVLIGLVLAVKPQH